MPGEKVSSEFSLSMQAGGETLECRGTILTSGDHSPELAEGALKDSESGYCINK